MRISGREWIVVASLALAAGGCKTKGAREHDPPPVAPPVPSPAPPAATTVPTVTAAPFSHAIHPAAGRIVAVGDLHGDLDHTKRALRLAGAIDEAGHWSGGKLVVVQTGDEIDRGDDDRAVLDAVETWKNEAKAAGGEFIAMLGNHELMNAKRDFRYVSANGYAAFSSFAAPRPGNSTTGSGGRTVAFAPGGEYAKILGTRPAVVKVGSTVFVHGGILPSHAQYGLDRINQELDDWLEGRLPLLPDLFTSDDGPLWTREYSTDQDPNACPTLDSVLASLGAERMVVGHTVQRRGITSACGGHVWRIDVGLSHVFGGPIEVLEIVDDRPRVLREGSSPSE
ncbi:MAG TPA: metallophosphoesterase [Polyangiaceae bacterium]|jgi:hypothetical protein|nr:metallophosphoesterase [Polyangiaceae bacterium]